MKNIAICYSEHAIKVSDSYCSGPSKPVIGSVSPHYTTPSIQNAVTSLYKVKLSSQKRFLVKLTWCNNLSSHGFNIGLSDYPFSVSKFSKSFRVQKGSENFESHGLRIEVLWDLNRARYESGPEPITGFYIAILINSELSLILGDIDWISDVKVAEFSLISRSERFSGNGVYSTKGKFSESGISHDIMIKCCGDDRKNPVLCVYVDKKIVIQVKRLQWNFRGNQSVFLDGLLVDLMWDVHDWLFNPSGFGVFLFRTRIGLDSRLWLEDKSFEHTTQHDNHVPFSFLISACKNPD